MLLVILASCCVIVLPPWVMPVPKAFDHAARAAYACRSPRTDESVLRELCEAGIEIHTQVVLCPGWKVVQSDVTLHTCHSITCNAVHVKCDNYVL